MPDTTPVLEGAELDRAVSSLSGTVPVMTGPSINPRNLQRETTDERAASFIDMVQADGERLRDFNEITEGANELIHQNSTNTEEPPRGSPDARISGRDIWRRGEARIRTLTDLFGQDALVLGHLLFQVPPLAIRIKKGNSTYRWKPLRTTESIAIKSGNGECWIEIDLAFVGLNQIQSSLAELISLWKKVPFCFIENVHIRNMMIPTRPDQSMAVCLETLVMDAMSGMPNTVHATLLTRWFNYKPFSQHFWFRNSWLPVAGTQNNSRVQDGSSTPEVGDGSPPTLEGRIPLPSNNSSSNILLDLSAMEDIGTLDSFSRDLPPEVGLFEAKQSHDPGDATLRGTYPVVYPFNSQPFLDRIRGGDERPVRIDSWGDSIRMNWNSFIRMQVPRSWQYTADAPPERSLIATNSRSRGREADTPDPVVGERDIIIFLGDSFMTGFTALAAREECISPASGGVDFSTPSFFEWTGNNRFPSTNNFRYIGMMRSGASSQTLLNWWNAKKDDPSLKADGSEAPCSRVAGVLIHSGINDGPDGPNLDALTSIMNEVSEFGAIPMLVTLPPVGDSTTSVPPKYTQLKLIYGESVAEGYLQALPDHHARMSRLVSNVDNAILIDDHQVLVDGTFRGNRSAPLVTRYQTGVSGQPTYYNLHWNDSGYSAAGNYIHGSMPWNSLRGQSEDEPNDLWTVCNVEDGDTVWVWGRHPDTGNPVLRQIRMQYIDTLETYHEFDDEQYNESGIAPMPLGQDSYRPENKRFGAIATNALKAQLPEGDQVRVVWSGTGYYGRFLGQIFKGNVNINLWMVEQGYAFAALPSNPDNEYEEQEVGFEFWQAEQIARGRSTPPSAPRGIWDLNEVPLQGLPSGFPTSVAENLRRVMRPNAYRATYAPKDGGGHGPTPTSCTDSGIEHELAPNNGGTDTNA